MNSQIALNTTVIYATGLGFVLGGIAVILALLMLDGIRAHKERNGQTKDQDDQV